MQVIPNQANIEGRLVHWQPTSEIEGFGLARVVVQSSRDVMGFANLLAQRVGEEIDVHVRTDTPPEGATVEMRVRMGGPGRYFVVSEG